MLMFTFTMSYPLSPNPLTPPPGLGGRDMEGFFGATIVEVVVVISDQKDLVNRTSPTLPLTALLDQLKVSR